jgi:hypothetical protein
VVFFNITTGTTAGFVISEAGFSGGSRDGDGSLTFSIGDVIVTVEERGAFLL